MAENTFIILLGGFALATLVASFFACQNIGLTDTPV